MMKKIEHLKKTTQAISNQIVAHKTSFLISFYSHYILKFLGFRSPVTIPASKFKFQNIYLNTRKNTIDFWACLETYEPDLTYFLCTVLKDRKGTFIDVGGHIGRFTVLMAKNNWKVITFEPVKTNFNQIIKNLNENNCSSNADVRNIGLGKNNEKLPIYFYEKEMGEASVISDQSRKRKEEIEIVRFDDCMKNYHYDELCVVKIDVEGGEENAVFGMKNFISENKPLIILELWEERSQNLIVFLKSLGYKRLHIFWFIEEKHGAVMKKMDVLYKKHGVVYG